MKNVAAAGEKGVGGRDRSIGIWLLDVSEKK